MSEKAKKTIAITVSGQANLGKTTVLAIIVKALRDAGLNDVKIGPDPLGEVDEFAEDMVANPENIPEVVNLINKRVESITVTEVHIGPSLSEYIPGLKK